MVEKLKSPRRLMALAVFAIVAMSAFGFAATNTVAGSKAGDGYGGISGYDVTNIHYTLGGQNISGVTLHLNSAASNVSVGFADDNAGLNATALATCSSTNGAKTNWSCDVSSLGVTAAQSAYIRVVAVG